MARLIEAEIPDFGRAAEPPQWRLGREGYQARLDRVRERMERHGWTHLIVYGDREHFANLGGSPGLTRGLRRPCWWLG